MHVIFSVVKTQKISTRSPEEVKQLPSESFVPDAALSNDNQIHFVYPQPSSQQIPLLNNDNEQYGLHAGQGGYYLQSPLVYAQIQEQEQHTVPEPSAQPPVAATEMVVEANSLEAGGLKRKSLAVASIAPTAMSAASLVAKKPSEQSSGGFNMLTNVSRDGWPFPAAARATNSEMSFQQQDLASYPSSLVLGGSKSSVCRCQNTKCLKLYCACFRDSKICGDSCKCVSCANTTDESGINGRLTLARQELLKKKPNAFGDRTCRCTKARCLRKYCVCFSAGVSCTYACKCVS